MSFKLSNPYGAPAHQADSILTQAAAVQNTWYTVLNTTANVRLINLAYMVDTADETLEIKITIDGNVLTGSVAATATTWYYASWDAISDGLQCNITNTSNVYGRSFFFEGRSVKVEIRKTTAAGAGTITADMKYAKW